MPPRFSLLLSPRALFGIIRPFSLAVIVEIMLGGYIDLVVEFFHFVYFLRMQTTSAFLDIGSQCNSSLIKALLAIFRLFLRNDICKWIVTVRSLSQHNSWATFASMYAERWGKNRFLNALYFLILSYFCIHTCWGKSLFGSGPRTFVTGQKKILPQTDLKWFFRLFKQLL